MLFTRRAGQVAALFAAALTLASCAELQIYSDPGLKTLTGIPFYVSKPYLLVSRTGAKDKPIEVQVIYMPDLLHPYYARIVPGLGSSETSMAFANSILTTVGQKSDAQLDELLTAFGGLQTSLATAGKTRRETDLLGDEAAPDYKAVADALTAIATQIETAERQARTDNLLTTEELDVLKATAAIAKTAAASLADPATAESGLAVTLASLKNAAKAWDEKVRPPSAATSGAEPIARRNLAALRAQLGDAITLLSPTPESPAAFTLYEITMDATGTHLVEIAQ